MKLKSLITNIYHFIYDNIFLVIKQFLFPDQILLANLEVCDIYITPHTYRNIKPKGLKEGKIYLDRKSNILVFENVKILCNSFMTSHLKNTRLTISFLGSCNIDCDDFLMNIHNCDIQMIGKNNTIKVGCNQFILDGDNKIFMPANIHLRDLNFEVNSEILLGLFSSCLTLTNSKIKYKSKYFKIPSNLDITFKRDSEIISF